MALFRSDPQHREKLTIWRILSLLPLYRTLSDGKMWRWFAINIPMRIGGYESYFTSDIDIMARLYDYPNSQEWIYKAWEVKVSLIHRDGSVSSLKVGKTKRTITQLKAYRNFGISEVTLLDINICENGFFKNNHYPPQELIDVASQKKVKLELEGFGYQMLSFELEEHSEDDFVLMANPYNILSSNKFGLRQPCSQLVDDINKFHENLGNVPRKPFLQIIFCKNCRQFQLISMKQVQNCPSCNDNLIFQS
jgi:hypothetical protein